MPERAFVTATFDDLTKSGGIIASLEQVLQNGQINQLRNNNTGFLTQFTPQSPKDVRKLYQQARYEARLRVLTLDDSDTTKAALLLTWADPYIERVMTVQNIRSCT